MSFFSSSMVRDACAAAAAPPLQARPRRIIVTCHARSGSTLLGEFLREVILADVDEDAARYAAESGPTTFLDPLAGIPRNHGESDAPAYIYYDMEPLHDLLMSHMGVGTARDRWGLVQGAKEWPGNTAVEMAASPMARCLYGHGKLDNVDDLCPARNALLLAKAASCDLSAAAMSVLDVVAPLGRYMDAASTEQGGPDGIVPPETTEAARDTPESLDRIAHLVDYWAFEERRCRDAVAALVKTVRINGHLGLVSAAMAAGTKAKPDTLEPGLVVQLIRDPRALLASRYEHHFGLPSDGGRDASSVEPWATAICEQTMSDADAGEVIERDGGRGNVRYLLISFEELASDPLSASAKIATSMGLEQIPSFAEEWLLNKVGGATVPGREQLNAKNTLNIGSRNGAAVAERWKASLDWWHVDVMQRACSEMMHRFGYDSMTEQQFIAERDRVQRDIDEERARGSAK